MTSAARSKLFDIAHEVNAPGGRAISSLPNQPLYFCSTGRMIFGLTIR